VYKGCRLKARNIGITLILGLNLLLFSVESVAATLIANVSVDDSSLSKKSLRRIFIMRQTKWSAGDPIKVFVMEQNTDIHQIFCKSVLGLFPYQLERQWNKLVYSGLGEAPVVVGGDQEMIEMIAATPGAVGYVKDYTPMEGVKVITLEGVYADE
jgi:ABC-type phosphate transport system substrate-binding protein